MMATEGDPISIVTAITTTSSWREQILSRLQQRKTREQVQWEEVIGLYSKVTDSLDTLKNENSVLTVQCDRLMGEVRRLKDHATPSSPGGKGGGGGSPLSSPITSPDHNHKMLRLQEELTELHRRKGEHAQELITVKSQLEERTAHIKVLTSQLADHEENIGQYKATLGERDKQLRSEQEKFKNLSDEHTTLVLAFNCLNDKMVRKEKEFAEMLQRYLALKASDAEKLNSENEQAHRKVLIQRQQELEAAIKDVPDTLNVTLPSHLIPCLPGSQVLGSVTDTKISEEPGVENTNAPMVNESRVSRIPNHKILDIDSHDGEVNAFKFDPSVDAITRTVLYTGGGDRKVKVWDIKPNSYELKQTLVGSNAAITSIDTHGDLVLASSNDFASRCWSSDGKLRRTLTGHGAKVFSVKFLGTQHRVVSGSHDRTLKIWDLNRHACTKTLFAGSSCNDLDIMGGECSLIMSGHYDKKIRFWETRVDSSCNEIQLEGKVTSVAVSPNQRFLLACVRDDTLKQLDLRQNQVVRTFLADGFRVGCDLTRAAWSPDSEYITAGSADGSIFFWNVQTGRVEKVLKDQQHSGHNLITCGWNPNGQIFVSCDNSKRSIIWA